jgi:protein TonB
MHFVLERALQRRKTGATRVIAWLVQPRRASIALAGGLLTLGLFLFLGALQPSLSDNDRVRLEEAISFELKAAVVKPPPPPEEDKEAKEPERRRAAPPARRMAAENASARRQLTRQPFAELLLQAGPSIASSVDLEIPVGPADVGGLVFDASASNAELKRAGQLARKEIEYQSLRERQLGAAQEARDFNRTLHSVSTRPARLVRRTDPKYPKRARDEGKEGVVLIRVLVSIDGRVQDFHLEADPPGYFEEAIETALPRWRFEPALDEDGRPIEEWVEYQLEFRLENA